MSPRVEEGAYLSSPQVLSPQFPGTSWAPARAQAPPHEDRQILDPGDPWGPGMAHPSQASSWQPACEALRCALHSQILTQRCRQWFGLIKLDAEVKPRWQ